MAPTGGRSSSRQKQGHFLDSVVKLWSEAELLCGASQSQSQVRGVQPEAELPGQVEEPRKEKTRDIQVPSTNTFGSCFGARASLIESHNTDWQKTPLPDWSPEFAQKNRWPGWPRITQSPSPIADFGPEIVGRDEDLCNALALQEGEGLEFAHYRHDTASKARQKSRMDARKWREARQREQTKLKREEKAQQDETGQNNRRESLLAPPKASTWQSPSRPKSVSHGNDVSLKEQLDNENKTHAHFVFENAMQQQEPASNGEKATSLFKKRAMQLSWSGGVETNAEKEERQAASFLKSLGSAKRFSEDMSARKVTKIMKAIKPAQSRQQRMTTLDKMLRKTVREERLLNVRKLEFEKLPKHEQENLASAFTQFDVDNSLNLNMQEVYAALDRFGLRGRSRPEKDEIHQIILEETCAGDADFYCFALNLVPRIRDCLRAGRQQALREHFLLLDADNTGYLDIDECREIVNRVVSANIDGEGHAQIEENFLDIFHKLKSPMSDGVEFSEFELLISSLTESSNRILAAREQYIVEAEGLSQEEITRFKGEILSLYEKFCTADRDGSGCLDAREVQRVLLTQGIIPRTIGDYLEITCHVSDCDKDGDGTLTFKEFLGLIKKIRSDDDAGAELQMQKLFNAYDKDRNGDLSMSELSVVISDLGLAPRCREDQEAMKQLLDEVDEDATGSLNFKEFQVLIRRIDEKLRALQFRRETKVAQRLGFTEKQVSELRDLFQELDTDMDDLLSINNLRQLLSAARRQMTAEELQECFTSLAGDMEAQGLNFEMFMEFAKIVNLFEGLKRKAPGRISMAPPPADR